MTPTDPGPADVVARLREAATSIRNDGTPAQVGLTAEECDEAADLITSLQARAETAEAEAAALRSESPEPSSSEVWVKPLEWEDADEGMCTKWRAAALGGHYELVDFGKDDPGFAVNFHWGRPFSFWFIQGEPDEWGPTGPKIFPTLQEAKAAAQADYEQRIRSALIPSPADGAVEALKAAKSAAYAVYVGFAGERDRLRDGDPLRALAQAQLEAAGAVLAAIAALLPREANSPALKGDTP